MLNRSSLVSSNGRPSRQETPEPSTEVDDKLDRVNELWNRLERKLLRRQPPRRIAVEIHHRVTGEDGDVLERHYLGIQKQHSKWRLCYAVEWPRFHEDEPHPEIPDDLSWKPVTECDLETRVFASNHVEKLKFEVDNTRTFFIPQLDETISRLEDALDDE